MMLSPILTGEINSLLTLRYSLNCVDDVLFSLIPNASHLSTQTIISQLTPLCEKV